MSKCLIIQPDNCYTCPFRPKVAKRFRDVRMAIALSATSEAGRICHSTGKDNLFHKDTGNPEMLCRGARDLQLTMFAATGFIDAPTDEAWARKCVEMGIEAPVTAAIPVRRPKPKP